MPAIKADEWRFENEPKTVHATFRPDGIKAISDDALAQLNEPVSVTFHAHFGPAAWTHMLRFFWTRRHVAMERACFNDFDWKD